jgi:hypothetical protein
VDEVESVLKSLVSRRERLMTLIREAQQLDVETPPERVCTHGLALALVPPLSFTREFSWLTLDALLFSFTPSRRMLGRVIENTARRRTWS